MGNETNINWFPGHMAKAIKEIKQKIDIVDMVVEIIDSRAPKASVNPIISDLVGNKCYLKVFTKTDLADDKITNEWKEYYKKENIQTVFCNLSQKDSFRKILDMIAIVSKPIKERDIRKGLLPRPVRVMVLGIPNVGKSTFINMLAKKASVGVANTPGYTKAQQWIRLKNIDLLDTPGILWPKMNDNNVGLKLALLGSVKSDILPTMELAKFVYSFLKENYSQMLYNKYGISIDLEFYAYLEAFATLKKHLLKNNVLDLDRSAIVFLNDFKNGIIGKISLERCEDDGWFRV